MNPFHFGYETGDVVDIYTGSRRFDYVKLVTNNPDFIGVTYDGEPLWIKVSSIEAIAG